ncbi:MAG: DUF2147 domain-containing protein [Alphaproteobacteria bacterium]|nr:DUF2147 domain-containing protein [Rhodospirillales bacterium]MBN9561535.1 DUF2147 domain-containing protein [Alphaproteobacteria bacterium]
MIKRLLVAALAIGLGGIARAETVSDRPPVGLWLTEDGGGVIRIAPCGQNLCGSIAGQSATGSDPPIAARCGLQILTVAPLRPGIWDGQITNPEDGRVWNVQISQDTDGTLHLRGYIGLPLFGATQIWTQYAGRIGAGCRMG